MIGRLTRDPELRYTNDNKAVCSFSVAVNRDKDRTDFINCVCWGTQAENLHKYQQKGALIGIVGQLISRTYEDTSKNKRTSYEVLCSEIEYLSSKPKEENEYSGMKTTEFQVGQQVEITDSDLPF